MVLFRFLAGDRDYFFMGTTIDVAGTMKIPREHSRPTYAIASLPNERFLVESRFELKRFLNQYRETKGRSFASDIIPRSVARNPMDPMGKLSTRSS